jgi:DNA-binding MarR family transcriptional regulator
MDNRERAVQLLDRMGRIAHGLQFALGLNPAQWEALRFLALANRRSRSPSALADFLGTTKGTASQTLIALESKGLVKRTRCVSDRRSVDLELTPQGVEMIGRDPMGLVLDAVSELSEGECETMNGVLGGLVTSLQRRIGLPEFGPCLDCAHFCEAIAEPEGQSGCRCALSQDELPQPDLDRVCANFESVA